MSRHARGTNNAGEQNAGHVISSQWLLTQLREEQAQQIDVLTASCQIEFLLT